MALRCPECGSENVGREPNGEIVCRVCGFVIEEGFISGDVLL